MSHRQSFPAIRWLVLALVIGSLAACTPAAGSPTSLPAAETPVSPSATSVPPPATPVPPSATSVPPTATALPPSPTPIPPAATVTSPPPTAIPATATQVPPSPTPAPQSVEMFLIALEDNGQSGKQIGCGDSVVPVQVLIPHTQGVLRAALEALLSLKEPYYGESGLYNALYQSDLQLESVTIEGGKAVIHLTGTFMLAGTCDIPRVEAQIEETALQFSTVSEVSVFVNGRPLEEVLSLK